MGPETPEFDPGACEELYYKAGHEAGPWVTVPANILPLSSFLLLELRSRFSAAIEGPYNEGLIVACTSCNDPPTSNKQRVFHNLINNQRPIEWTDQRPK
jgi:hypothetical protein